VLNDRAAAGLGRELARTGRLSQEGVDLALAAARRFRLFLDARRVREVRVVGTAAVRVAADAASFVNEFERAIGAKLRVLTGEEEGRYAALGVLAGEPAARGLVADMGGSSLELAPVGDGVVQPPVTLMLGAFAMSARAGGDVKAARAVVDEALGAAKIDPVTDSTLYVVGGAWRNLAKIDMVRRDYPLKVLQGYEMSPAEAIDISRFLAKQSPASIARMSEASRRRAEAIPFAAVALERLVKHFGVRAVVVSSYGLREGVLLDTMPERIRKADPLLAGAEAMARRAGSEVAFGRALEGWVAPAAEAMGASFDRAQLNRLCIAACRLADIGGALHPDHRAELASREVLYAQFAGLSHAERVFLSRVIHHRYAGRRELDGPAGLNRIITPEARDTALRLGLALRLAGAISARSATLLAESQLELSDREIKLLLTRKGAVLATEMVERRLEQLALAFERAPKIEVV
jgi:exopolyphosphatase/guanosine-5'-triphosphate,3'-diphosphate pyrophosphatase